MPVLLSLVGCNSRRVKAEQIDKEGRMLPKGIAVLLVALSILAHSCGSADSSSMTSATVDSLPLATTLNSGSGQDATPQPIATRWVAPSPYPTWPTPTPEPTMLDNTLYGVPCRPPCWNGLTPGQSTREEVVQVLDQLLASGQAHHITEHGENLAFFPGKVTEPGEVFLEVRAGILYTVGSRIAFDYYLGDLVALVGPPEFIYPYEESTESSAQDNPCEDWTPGSYNEYYEQVFLIYPRQGLLYQMRVPGNGLGAMCPQMRVHHYCYYPPTTMQDILDNLEKVSQGSEEAIEDTNRCVIWMRGATEEALIQWHGFGKGY